MKEFRKDMIQVEKRKTGVVFPSQQIKVVAMQPHVHLTDTEPFRWPAGEKEKQIDGIKRTLEISKNKQAHFTLFPEYSIPGLDGVGAIDEVIASNDWPNNTIIIGGIDGLSKTEYQQLFQPNNTECHPNNKPDKVANGYWVNCCVIWIKCDAGSIKKYLQPKISKAKDELLTPCYNLFPGSSVYNFIGILNYVDDATYEFHFFTLICFDWIYKHQGKLLNQLILEELNKNTQRLEWVFLPQHNPKPNYSEFVGSTTSFFDDAICNNVIRHDTAIFFINSATDDKPSLYIPDTYGVSSIVFHARANILSDGCKHTACFKKGKYRNLNNCHDIVFREMGACVHSFEVPVPRFLQRAMGSLSLPIQQAEVYPIIDGEPDPRLPGAEVPACVKWVNDKLDNIESLGTRSPNVMTAETNSSHERLIPKLRTLPAIKQQNNVHYATASHSANNSISGADADSWSTQEKDSLQHLLHTTTICGIGDNGIDLECSTLHARTTIDGKLYEIVAVNGQTHDDCTKHFDNVCKHKINHPILLISRDVDNNPFTARFAKKITKFNPSIRVSEPNITDVECSRIQKGYRELLNIYKSSQNEQNLRQGLTHYVT